MKWILLLRNNFVFKLEQKYFKRINGSFICLLVLFKLVSAWKVNNPTKNFGDGKTKIMFFTKHVFMFSLKLFFLNFELFIMVLDV